jgi:hypothetical protein
LRRKRPPQTPYLLPIEGGAKSLYNCKHIESSDRR